MVATDTAQSSWASRVRLPMRVLVGVLLGMAAASGVSRWMYDVGLENGGLRQFVGVTAFLLAVGLCYSD